MPTSGEGTGALRSLQLVNFKGFDRFDVSFPDVAVLIGPNNAGKSTIVTALRAVATMVRTARRRRPPAFDRLAFVPANSFPMAAGSVSIEEENLRHEFRLERETRIEARFTGGAVLRAVWPGEDSDQRPHYLLTRRDGRALASVGDVRALVPSIGTIPVLTPLEHRERVLSPDYVQTHLSSRLASRHFRNQLQLLEGGESETHRDALDEFLDFAKEWLPEIPIERPRRTTDGENAYFDVFYREGRTPKELVWAGDGVQVFIQLLLHFYRLRDSEVIVLDEPDVYLHADLQRRLTRMLSATAHQVILATHSPEILVEAPLNAGILVDRSKRKALRVSDPVVAADLDLTMGTAFNLRLAKVLRVRYAVFVEGDDVSVLRRLAVLRGHKGLATEANLAVVKLGGGANRRRLESFRWIASELLGDAIQGYVLLDRDYHSDSAADEMRRELKQFGVECHVWKRHELENYLVEVEPIARLVGVEPSVVERIIEAATDELRTTVLLEMIAVRAEEAPKKHALVTINKACESELGARWKTIPDRVAVCPGKELLAAINRRLQAEGYSAVSTAALAEAFGADEIPSEVVHVLDRIEEAASEVLRSGR